MPREPVWRNTCHGPRTSLPQCDFHSTNHVQQNISQHQPLYESLLLIRVAEHTDFTRDDKTADNLKTIDQTTCISVSICKQAPFKQGGVSRLRDLLGVLRVVNCVQMPQEPWLKGIPGSQLGHLWVPDFWPASMGPRRKRGHSGSL